MRRDARIVRRLAIGLALNLVLVFLCCLVVIPPRLGLGWGMFLTSTARERLQAVAESLISEVGPAFGAGIRADLQRYDSLYSVRFAVFDGDGVELSSTGTVPPRDLQADLKKTRALLSTEPAGAAASTSTVSANGSVGLPVWPRVSREQLERWSYTESEGAWGPVWIGIRTFIPEPNELLPVTVLVRAQNPWIALRFISFREWVSWLALLLGVSVCAWVPFVWRGSRDLREIIAATERIAEEQFTVRVGVHRADELGRLAGAVDTVAERLENFVRNQRQFLSNIAHEVSSPLARLKIGLQNLADEAQGTAEASLADVNEEVDLLTELVSEILAFTRAGLIEPGARLQLISLRALVSTTLERENAQLVRVTMPNDLQIRTNPASLQRALGNLVRNALRYAGTANGPIELIAEAGPNAVAIRVLDRGPGVPEIALLRLGDPFYRPEPARQRTSGGLGLGLATVKNCVAACRGSVSFRNRSGGGFEATILLPSADTAPVEAASVSARRE